MGRRDLVESKWPSGRSKWARRSSWLFFWRKAWIVGREASIRVVSWTWLFSMGTSKLQRRMIFWLVIWFRWSDSFLYIWRFLSPSLAGGHEGGSWINNKNPLSQELSILVSVHLTEGKITRDR